MHSTLLNIFVCLNFMSPKCNLIDNNFKSDWNRWWAGICKHDRADVIAFCRNAQLILADCVYRTFAFSHAWQITI